ncbi:MAG TPA: hypothetical protein VF779_05860 [Pyrinomonadaceae bacterium]
MNSLISFRRRIALSCPLLLTFALLGAYEACAQDMRTAFVPAPPPMKFVPRTERTQLQSMSDAKAHTRAAIELAEAHLMRAEQLTSSQQFDAASAEMGIYQGLIEDALRFLHDASNGKGNKMRDTYKHLELAIRAHCTRLEAIRRVTPSEYAVNVKAICEYARDARDAAINSFYGDDVIKDSAEGEKVSNDVGAKDAPSNQAKKQ